MAWEITTYKESLVEELIDVFNRETEPDPFVVPLTPTILADQITSKPLFSPEGCFLALERGKAIGFALTAPAIDSQRQSAGQTAGVIDGLFFPYDRLEVGDALLARSLDHLMQGTGVDTVYGFASYGGYPFWRGLYCGAEPVCLTHYSHAWSATMARGFVHHQQAMNYLGTPEPRAYRQDLEYVETDLDVSAGWTSQSWKGHSPKLISLHGKGEPMGYVGYAHLPFLSQYRDKSIVGIYGLQVYPRFRRQGMATCLLSCLFDRAFELRVQEILVGTTVENTAARRTYEKAGMRLIAFRTGTMYRRPHPRSS